jgi:iron complex outermembrane receptor protein
VDANISIGEKFALQPNAALSINRNKDFVFQRDGILEELGNTNIAYSPNVVLGNIFVYSPTTNFQMSLLSKYVGKQYMGNIDSDTSVLDAYSQTDFNIQYELKCNGFLKSIVFSGLVNNIFNAKFESNGYFFTFDDDFSVPNTVTTVEGAGFYPQAGTNFLLGATLNF